MNLPAPSKKDNHTDSENHSSKGKFFTCSERTGTTSEHNPKRCKGYDDDESLIAENEIFRNSVMMSVRKIEQKELLQANECFYFLIETYERMIIQFRIFNEALGSLVEEEKKFFELKTSLLIENSFLIFSNTFETFPLKIEENFKQLTRIKEQMKKDFTQFIKKCPRKDAVLNRQLKRFKDVLDGEKISLIEFKAVNYIHPRSLMSSFEDIQKAYHKIDRDKKKLEVLEDFVCFKFDSAWA